MQSIMSLKSNLVLASALLACHGAAMAQNAPLDGLVKAAAQWAALSDANQNDRMWDSSGQIMQKGINKQDWAKYLTNLHNELGPLKNRDWIQVTRVVNPTGLPAGEYINVLFNSRFTKSPAIVEKVSLIQYSGKWIPVGYVVNKVEQPAPSPATTPVAGNKAPAK